MSLCMLLIFNGMHVLCCRQPMYTCGGQFPQKFVKKCGKILQKFTSMKCCYEVIFYGTGLYIIIQSSHDIASELYSTHVWWRTACWVLLIVCFTVVLNANILLPMVHANMIPLSWFNALAVWPAGSDISHVNEVTLHRAQLVPRWVTVHECTVLVCNQPHSPTPPSTLCRKGNEYQWRGNGIALHREGNRRFSITMTCVTDSVVYPTTGSVA